MASLAFPFDNWIEHPVGLGSIPTELHGQEGAIVGAGISGLIAETRPFPTR
jgi:lysine 2-monooxygenase